jgi:hypothetical protein
MVASSAPAQQPKEKMLPVVTITATGTNVNSKVPKAFARSFKDAEKMSWYEVNQNYLVNFIQNEQQNKALFTRTGSLVYHITYGYEKNLPKDIRHQIKSEYYDYQITRVFNVRQNRRDVWVINLEDDNHVILAKVEEDQMNEVNRFKKNEYSEGALTKSKINR